MRGAAVFEYVKMPEVRWDAGRGAVLLHQQVERGAVDRPLLFAQEDRARKGSPDFQPGAERPGFLAHQVVMAGVGALQPVNEDLVSLGVTLRIFLPHRKSPFSD